MSLSTFKIATSWDDPGGVRTPELAATWGKVRILAGNVVVTRVLDRRAETVREEVYFPLYPLAEWVACNWFFLLHEVPNPRKQNREIEHRHNIRSGRDGFSFPSLTIWPEGEITRIEARRFSAQDESVEYLVEECAEVCSDNFRAELTRFLNLVCERLASKGITGTLLQEEWHAIQEMDRDESEFSVACAKLGQDPFAIDDRDAESVVNASSLLSPELRDDFFEAADLNGLTEQLKSLRRYLQNIDQDTADVTALKKLRKTPLPNEANMLPWEQGYEAARRLRETLGLNGMVLDSNSALGQAFGLHASEWKAWFRRPRTVPDFFDSLVALNKKQSPVFIIPPRRGETQRFSFCRAMFEYLSSNGSALTHSSHSGRQKRNRAFAAEFLVPATAIKSKLLSDFADEDTIAALARRFGVSEFVVEHQIRNHKLAETARQIY